MAMHGIGPLKSASPAGHGSDVRRWGEGGKEKGRYATEDFQKDARQAAQRRSSASRISTASSRETSICLSGNPFAKIPTYPDVHQSIARGASEPFISAIPWPNTHRTPRCRSLLRRNRHRPRAPAAPRSLAARATMAASDLAAEFRELALAPELHRRLSALGPIGQRSKGALLTAVSALSAATGAADAWSPVKVRCRASRSVSAVARRRNARCGPGAGVQSAHLHGFRRGGRRGHAGHAAVGSATCGRAGRE
eukprot:scaffold462_cov195-Pinguiococcus_pyrenoidosus.AAC.89